MKQIWITRKGAPEVLMVKEAQDPSPQAGEVLINVKAAGINFSDILARRGRYPEAPQPPMVVGYEVSGVIEAVGKKEDSGLQGKSVLAPVFFGGYSTKVCVPKEQVFELPQGMGFSQGAALPVNYLTAYGMAFKMARIKKGDRVLIHSAGGGVGLALFDLCKISGASPYGIASIQKHERLKARGFSQLVDARSNNLESDLMKLSNSKGFDFIFDSSGGESWSQGLQLLSPLGKLIAFGFANSLNELTTGKSARPSGAGQWYTADLFQLAQGNMALAGFNLATLWKKSFSLLGEWMKELLVFYKAGQLNITIDKEFSFTDAPKAHQYIENRENFGKVVLLNS
ncbi:MAG: alcohol dehydrogenase [Proteobacteria bacterium]|nr:alcohol dehydrogenase [Pseudomonadota bacterium]